MLKQHLSVDIDVTINSQFVVIQVCKEAIQACTDGIIRTAITVRLATKITIELDAAAYAGVSFAKV